MVREGLPPVALPIAVTGVTRAPISAFPESEWAPAHSNGCGARFRCTKRSDYSGLIAALRAWPSHARRRGYFQNFSRASRSALRSRPRDGDPKLVGIKQSVQVESWLLQTTVVRCSSEISTNPVNMHAIVAVVKLQSPPAGGLSAPGRRWSALAAYQKGDHPRGPAGGRCPESQRLHDAPWRNLYKSKVSAEIEDISYFETIRW
jgi:hypothetical protein